MNYYHQYLTPVIGILIIVCAILMYIFPPEYGNSRFGIITEWTMKNKASWARGQKMFAIAIFIIGGIFFLLGCLKLQDKWSPFSMFLILLFLWKFSKWIISWLLSKKYTSINSTNQ